MPLGRSCPGALLRQPFTAKAGILGTPDAGRLSHRGLGGRLPGTRASALAHRPLFEAGLAAADQRRTHPLEMSRS